jgi:hypothetical protein
LNNTTGYSNTALGVQALQDNTTGTYNTAVGSGVLALNTTGYNNTAVGVSALNSNTRGYDNTAFGVNALLNNTDGYHNVALGTNALNANTTGYSNDAIGNSSLENNTAGYWNVALGSYSLAANTTGAGNTVLGYNAGYTSNSSNANTTGSGNTFIGSGSGPGTSTQLQNATAIGTYSVVSESNALVLGCINGTNGCSATTEVGIGTTAPGNLLSIGALTTAAGSYQVAVSTGGTSNSGIVVQTVAGQSSGYVFQAQNSSGALLASIDYSGNLIVKSATINGSISVNGHVISGNLSGDVTTTTAQTALGSTGTCVINPTNFSTGNDTAGTIVLTPGGSGIAAGTQCTVNFGSSYATYPHVLVTPTNAASAALLAYGAATASTSFSIGFTNAGTSGTAYTFNYYVIQ